MDIDTLLKRMDFPDEWRAWGMFTPELERLLLADFQEDDEPGSEHVRNGAFHWWLRQSPDAATLAKLARLSALDPDPPMARDARRYIRASANADDIVRRMIDDIDGKAAGTTASALLPTDNIERY